MDLCDTNGLTEQEFLASYNPGDYPRPSIAADMAIFTVTDLPEDNRRKLAEKELRILLIRRGGHPFLGQWALPGGFVRPTETVGQAAQRELLEETGVGGGYLEQLYTFSTPGRDPRTWVMSCAHMALVNSDSLHLSAGDDASDAGWFRVGFDNVEASGQQQLTLTKDDIVLKAIVADAVDNGEPQIIENQGLAFDHAKIIVCALQRLRSKLEYTDLALSLMPKLFTLTALQQAYETILGKPLLKAAFRRKIAHLVEETELSTEGDGHRPAKLFHRASFGFIERKSP